MAERVENHFLSVIDHVVIEMELIHDLLKILGNLYRYSSNRGGKDQAVARFIYGKLLKCRADFIGDVGVSVFSAFGITDNDQLIFHIDIRPSQGKDFPSSESTTQ